MRGDKRYTERDIDDNLSQIYGALGNLYNLQDKALLAIEYYQKALPIFEKYDWKESQTILHHNVAELWLTMGNNEKAEQEYLRAIETGTASGDSLMMALPRKGLSKIYLDKGDYNQLRAYYSLPTTTTTPIATKNQTTMPRYWPRWQRCISWMATKTYPKPVPLHRRP